VGRGLTATDRRRRVSPTEDLTLSSRFECKYIVDPHLVPAMRHHIEPFMRPDGYAARRPGYRYPICSLYLDSLDLALYQQTVAGERDRFKLRIRTYSDDESQPAFFEAKLRKNSIVRKRRSRLERATARKLLGQGAVRWPKLTPPTSSDALDFFVDHATLTEARPVIRVRYNREAYESRGGDPVRVTIDTDLMHAATLEPEIRHAPGRWVSTPVNGAILELKFSDNFPGWMNELVQLFGLKQQPVPKYVMSLDHLMLDGREAVLALGGFQLPPRRV
jgi:hypothetical protein